MSEPEHPRSDGVAKVWLGSFQLASTLLLVALIVIGVGLILTDHLFGFLFVDAAMMALIWVIVETRKRDIASRPTASSKVLRGFALTMGNIFVVLLSSMIAFFSTCFPVGLLGLNREKGDITFATACLVGGLSAIAVGALVVYRLRGYRGNPG